MWCVEDINRAARRWTLRGFLDDDPAKHGGFVCGRPILGPLDAAAELADARFLVGMAHYNRPLVRKDVVQRLQLPSERFATLVHPHAAIAPEVSVGVGTVVFEGTIVCHAARVGDHCFIGHRSVSSPTTRSSTTTRRSRLA